jgi:hypothetical protein
LALNFGISGGRCPIPKPGIHQQLSHTPSLFGLFSRYFKKTRNFKLTKNGVKWHSGHANMDEWILGYKMGHEITLSEELRKKHE